MDIKELANQAGKSGSVPDPELVKVEIQVRTGTMYPLPDWMDPADQGRADQSPPKDKR